jgi:hypothetical protein
VFKKEDVLLFIFSGFLSGMISYFLMFLFFFNIYL